jgi:hypothetical protein
VAFSLGGSVTLTNPGGLDTFTISLYDLSANKAVIYSYNQTQDGTFSAPWYTGTLIAGRSYELVENGGISNVGIPDPLLTSSMQLSLTSAPEPTEYVPVALAMLAGLSVIKRRVGAASCRGK